MNTPPTSNGLRNSEKYRSPTDSIRISTRNKNATPDSEMMKEESAQSPIEPSFVGSLKTLPSFYHQNSIVSRQSNNSSKKTDKASLYRATRSESFYIPEDSMEQMTNRESMRNSLRLSMINDVKKATGNKEMAEAVVIALNEKSPEYQETQESDISKNRSIDPPVVLSRRASTENNSIADMLGKIWKFLISPPAEEMILHRKWYIIYPEVPLKNLWDIWIGVLILLITLLLPFQICFLDPQGLSTPDWWGKLEIAMTASFMLDLVLNFFQAYRDSDKQLHDDLRSIALSYLKTFFLLDLVAAFPFEFIDVGDDENLSQLGQFGKLSRISRFVKLFRLLRLLRLLKIYHIGKMIRELEIKFRIHHGLTRLNRIVVSIVFVNHTAACIWFWIGREYNYCGMDSWYSDTSEDVYHCSWLTQDGYAYPYEDTTIDLRRQYLASFYFSLTTLTTVGYGDISGGTKQEQIFCMVTIIFGVGWYSYILGSTSSIISSFTTTGSIIAKKKKEIMQFIRDTNMDHTLARNIRWHFENLSRKKTWLMVSDQYDANEILQLLNPELKSKVITFLERRLIEKIPFLQAKTLKFQADLVRIMQPKMVTVNDPIFLENELSDGLFFITSGKAVASIEQEPFGVYNEGDRVGESGLLSNGIQLMTAKALATCHLEGLPFQVFFQLKEIFESEMNEIWESAHLELELIALFKGLSPRSKKKFRKQSQGKWMALKKQTITRSKSLDDISRDPSSRITPQQEKLHTYGPQAPGYDGPITGNTFFPDAGTAHINMGKGGRTDMVLRGKFGGAGKTPVKAGSRFGNMWASSSRIRGSTSNTLVESSVDHNLMHPQDVQAAREIYATTKRRKTWQSNHVLNLQHSNKSFSFRDAEGTNASSSNRSIESLNFVDSQEALSRHNNGSSQITSSMDKAITRVLEERTEVMLEAVQQKLDLFVAQSKKKTK